MTAAFDPERVRALFPALAREIDGRPALFLDGPGGTQVPTPVIAAMREYLERSNANLGGPFATSRETVALAAATRAAAAAFLGAASPDEIVFGQTMTSLTFAASRALAREWRSGDEIVVTSLDQDANVAPWMAAAEDRGATVRLLRCEPGDCTLKAERLAELLGARTRLVALPYASNAVGTIPDLAPLIAASRRVGALTYVDAVHYAPHGAIDVDALGCDFLACSAYKFGGPHLGMLYGRKALLEALRPYKVRPSPAVPPGKWETGTQNFEAFAGLLACLRYLGGLADAAAPLSRSALARSMELIRAHERALSQRFIAGLAGIRGVQLHGIADPARLDERTPTFGLTIDGLEPRRAAERLGERGVFAWSGHFYAVGLFGQLGLAERGGLLRLGFAHYTTRDEVERTLDEVRALAA
jgi:cysteine desulfurase family protein (TIGR01976 family)